MTNIVTAELVGLAIRRFREARQISQKELADNCKCTEADINNIEHGHEMGIELWRRSAYMLGLELSCLLKVIEQDKVRSPDRSYRCAKCGANDPKCFLELNIAEYYLCERCQIAVIKFLEHCPQTIKSDYLEKLRSGEEEF